MTVYKPPQRVWKHSLVQPLGVELPENQFDFIPSDEFENATEQDFVDIDVDIYAEEDRPSSPNSSAESFLRAVAQSRLLTVDGERFLFKRLNFSNCFGFIFKSKSLSG